MAARPQAPLPPVVTRPRPALVMQPASAATTKHSEPTAAERMPDSFNEDIAAARLRVISS
jgi:hypothetical protein